MDSFSLRVASDPDYENLVMEVFFGETPVAVLDNDLGDGKERLFFCSAAAGIKMPFNELLQVLQDARDEIRTHQKS